MTFTFGSVCSGIEAASVAWDPLGWRAAFLAEIEAFPRAVLAHRQGAWDARRTRPAAGGPALWGDFAAMRPRHLRRLGIRHAIDLLVGGTPCQSFSVAGLRGGLDDARGNLALAFCRLARRLRPRWVVWENVPGVLSSGGGRDFGAIVGGLAELGYGLAWRVLDAQHFGVPQRRRRVFLVGYLGDARRARAVLFEPESLRRDHAPRRKARKGVARPLAACAPVGSGYRNDADTADNLIAAPILADTLSVGANQTSGFIGEAVAFGGNNTAGPIDVAAALNAHGGPNGRQDFETETFVATVAPALNASNPYGDHEGREGLLVAHALRAEGFDASEDGTGRGTSLVPVAFDTTQITSAENRCRPEPGDPCHPLAAGAHAPAIAFNSREDPVSGDRFGALGSSSPQAQAVASRAAVRRLTLRECERLQGFPDDCTLIPRAADGPRYRALGNSMAVPVMAWLGRRIAFVDAIPHDGRAAA